jgi:hypothetical protein
MPRPKSERHSTDLDAEITRLEQERKRLIESEDQRRGAIIRDCLASSNGPQLRAVLQPLINSRDAFLFGLEGERMSASRPSGATRATTSRRAAGEPSGQTVEARQSAAAAPG